MLAFDSLRRRWRLLVFWNTTCVTCERVLRSIEPLARDFDDAVLLIAEGEPIERVQRYLAIRGVHLVPAVHWEELARHSFRWERHRGDDRRPAPVRWRALAVEHANRVIVYSRGRSDES
jgi:hypothetical protein